MTPLIFIDSRQATLETSWVSGDEDEQRELVASLRSARDEARNAPEEWPPMPEPTDPTRAAETLPEIVAEPSGENPTSPAGLYSGSSLDAW